MENLYLVASLWVVRGGYPMIDAVFFHKGFKCMIAEMFSTIANDCTREAKMKKYVLFQEVYHNFVVIGSICYDLYQFRDMANCHKDILVSMRHREGTHEVDAPNIEDFCWPGGLPL